MNQHTTQHKKRISFTPEDDEKIKHYKELGLSFQEIAAHFENKTTRQIRERYKIFLDSSVDLSPLTDEEMQLLIKKHEELGNKWTKISKFFKNRSPKRLSNAFQSYNRKQLPGQPKSVQTNPPFLPYNPQIIYISHNQPIYVSYPKRLEYNPPPPNIPQNQLSANIPQNLQTTNIPQNLPTTNISHNHDIDNTSIINDMPSNENSENNNVLNLSTMSLIHEEMGHQISDQSPGENQETQFTNSPEPQPEIPDTAMYGGNSNSIEPPNIDQDNFSDLDLKYPDDYLYNELLSTMSDWNNPITGPAQIDDDFS